MRFDMNVPSTIAVEPVPSTVLKYDQPTIPANRKGGYGPSTLMRTTRLNTSARTPAWNSGRPTAQRSPKAARR
jgi:hypothetical protein